MFFFDNTQICASIINFFKHNFLLCANKIDNRVSKSLECLHWFQSAGKISYEFCWNLLSLCYSAFLKFILLKNFRGVPWNFQKNCIFFCDFYLAGFKDSILNEKLNNNTQNRKILTNLKRFLRNFPRIIFKVKFVVYIAKLYYIE